MKLGIDFGTTRIVVSAADRGNYPLVPFETSDGVFEWFPPLIAIHGDERRFGWEAYAMQGEPGWTIVRSLKRYLEDAGPHSQLDLGVARGSAFRSDAGLVGALRHALLAHFGESEPLEVVLGVPANANSNQRFLTVDAFRRAGFSVLGLLNEPSAASIEFGHRQKITGRLLVYDLGGGTCDVSLVEIAAGTHTVLASEGISHLGGDDFDLVLAEMAIGEEALAKLDAGRDFPARRGMPPSERGAASELAQDRHRSRCRAGRPGTGDGLGGRFLRALPASARRIGRQRPRSPREDIDIEALYVTGGGSELPLVSRVLREEFGRKVKRSEYTRSATAIGLAIQADAASGYTLREMFTRNFGVWREGDAGQAHDFRSHFPARHASAWRGRAAADGPPALSAGA